MPTYVYRREDGTTFEIEQRITDDPLTECPETGQPVKRVITGGTGIIFKGSGFYITDYERNGNGAASPAPSSISNGHADAEKTSSNGTASTSESSSSDSDA